MKKECLCKSCNYKDCNSANCQYDCNNDDKSCEIDGTYVWECSNYTGKGIYKK